MWNILDILILQEYVLQEFKTEDVILVKGLLKMHYKFNNQLSDLSSFSSAAGWALSGASVIMYKQEWAWKAKGITL